MMGRLVHIGPVSEMPRVSRVGSRAGPSPWHRGYKDNDKTSGTSTKYWYSYRLYGLCHFVLHPVVSINIIVLWDNSR